MVQHITTPKTGLHRQRWFGIALTVALMLLGSLLFTARGPMVPFSVHLDGVGFIMAGPFSLPTVQPFVLHSPGWLILIAASVCLLPLHPLWPSGGTLCATLLGGFLWWFLGFLALIAGC